MQASSTYPRSGSAASRSLLALMTTLILAAGSSASPAVGDGASAAKPKPAPIKPTFNAYFPSDFKNASYQQAAVGRVSKHWMVPGSHLPAKGSKTVVQSTIARDGSLGATLVTMKSGSKEWDDAALAAVTKGSPFGPLPGSYPHSTIEVHWHFSAN